MSRIYVSGPMRGHPRFNYANFDDLTAQLRSSGYEVINPADRDREVHPDIETWSGFAEGDLDALKAGGFTLESMLAWDLKQVADCDEFVLLPGWENSTGAGHERYVAEVTGKPIWLATKGTSLLWHLEWDETQLRVSAAAGADAEEPAGFDPEMERLLAEEAEINRRISSVGEEGRAEYDAAWQDRYEAMAHALKPSRLIRAGSYNTKDSGARVEFASGMVRDTTEGKPRYDLIPLMPLRRLAELYARGAEKYGDSNWQLAHSPEELARFRASAFRHFVQWLNGETDEDHAIGAVWNIFAVLWVEEKLTEEQAQADLLDSINRGYTERELHRVDL